MSDNKELKKLASRAKDKANIKYRMRLQAEVMFVKLNSGKIKRDEVGYYFLQYGYSFTTTQRNITHLVDMGVLSEDDFGFLYFVHDLPPIPKKDDTEELLKFS